MGMTFRKDHLRNGGLPARQARLVPKHWVARVDVDESTLVDVCIQGEGADQKERDTPEEI